MAFHGDDGAAVGRSQLDHLIEGVAIQVGAERLLVRFEEHLEGEQRAVRKAALLLLAGDQGGHLLFVEARRALRSDAAQAGLQRTVVPGGALQ